MSGLYILKGNDFWRSGGGNVKLDIKRQVLFNLFDTYYPTFYLFSSKCHFFSPMRKHTIWEISALFSGFSLFIILLDFISEETVWLNSSWKLLRRTDKLVLIRRWSQTPTANNCGLKRQLLIIRCRSSTKRHLRMKKKVPITVDKKKTVERKNNFPAGYVQLLGETISKGGGRDWGFRKWKKVSRWIGVFSLGSRI